MTSQDAAAPISTGPPAPLSIRFTRRRMSARMMRSPRSASATSSDRTLSGEISNVSTSPSAVAVDQRRPTGELSDLGQELTRSLLDDRRDVSEAVALGDRHCARQHHKHAGPRLTGFEQSLAAGVCAQRSETAQPLDLPRRQRGEGLIVARAMRRKAHRSRHSYVFLDRPPAHLGRGAAGRGLPGIVTCANFACQPRGALVVSTPSKGTRRLRRTATRTAPPCRARPRSRAGDCTWRCARCGWRSRS